MIIWDNFCLFCMKTLCCELSSELSQGDGSEEGSQHTVSMRNKENYLQILPFIYNSAIIILKMEQFGIAMQYVQFKMQMKFHNTGVHRKDAFGMANSVGTRAVDKREYLMISFS